MLFNPKAERFTLHQLRTLAINMREDLKERLDECLREKRYAQDLYVQCKKDEYDQKVFADEMKHLDDYIDRIDKTAYRQITHHLLSTESLYGFGTPLPITPQSAVEVVMPNYWLFLELNPEKSEAFGHGLHYAGIFFQRQEDVPVETITLIRQRQSNSSVSAPDMNQPATAPSSDAKYYQSPYLKLMIEAAEHFGINESNPTMKKYIVGWFKEQGEKIGLELSERMLEMMGTAMRPPEAQKGGIKSADKPIPKGGTVKSPEAA